MRGSYATLAVHLIGAALGLLVHVALTWLLGSETEYGIYLVALSTVTIAAVPVVAGWDTVLTRYLSEYDERREGSGSGGLPTAVEASEQTARQQRAEAVTRHAAARLTRWSLLSVGIGLAIAVAIAAAPATFRPWTPVTAIGVAISIPIVAWTLLRQGALRGRHRGALSIVPEAIVRPTMTVAVSALAIGLGAAATGNLVLLAQVVAGSAALICGSRFLPRGLRQAMLPNWNGRRGGLDPIDACGAEAVESWRRMAGASLLTGVAVAVTMRVDEWLLGLMVGPDAAGIYGPASRFAAFVAFLRLGVRSERRQSGARPPRRSPSLGHRSLPQAGETSGSLLADRRAADDVPAADATELGARRASRGVRRIGRSPSTVGGRAVRECGVRQRRHLVGDDGASPRASQDSGRRCGRGHRALPDPDPDLRGSRSGDRHRRHDHRLERRLLVGGPQAARLRPDRLLSLDRGGGPTIPSGAHVDRAKVPVD
ncbi:MAG TPA: hypothetical protein PLI18_05930 [Pirellulaceae bacterium]|nr:hypothetical protein [Pirellulaceae bacterium]